TWATAMVTVLSSSRSVPPLAISLYVLTFKSGLNFAAERITSAAVSVVLPWSMWPMVPTLTCGLVRAKTSLAIFPPQVQSKANHDHSNHPPGWPRGEYSYPRAYRNALPKAAAGD